MICVVLDSNVFLSALLFGGNPRRVIELVERGLISASISPQIRSEVERILEEKFSWPRNRITEATDYLWQLALTLEPTVRVSDCRDPDDNPVLECALAGSAIAIVTGDRDLLDLHPYRGISILTPRQFLELRLWDVQ